MEKARDWRAEFDRQIDEARPILFSIATRIVGSEDAEDVVQTALMRTWREAHRLKGPQCYARWATMVVRSAAIDAHRKKARHPTSSLPDGDESYRMQPDRPADAESVVLGKLDEEKAVQALANMPARHAAILYERDALDLEYKDILERHDLTFGQLRNILHRSRQKFRHEFARLGIGLGALAGWFRPGRHTATTTGTHAQVAVVRATLIPRFAVGLAGIIAGAAGVAVIAMNTSGPAPADQVPVAAIISTDAAQGPASPTSSPAATPTAAPATSPTASSPVTPTRVQPTVTKPAAPTTPAPRVTSPHAKQATAQPTSQPAHTSSQPAPQSKPTAPSPQASIAAPKLGDGAPTHPNTAGIGAASQISVAPTCRTSSGGSTIVTWSIRSDITARIGDHNGSGSPLAIPAGHSGLWQQSLRNSDTGTWWFDIIDPNGTVLTSAHYSGASIATIPHC